MDSSTCHQTHRGIEEPLEGLVLVIVAPLHACIAAGLFTFLAPLVLLLGLLGLASLHGRIVHALALLVVADGSHRLLVGSDAGGDAEQLVGVNRWALPSSRTRSRQVVPSKKACIVGVLDWQPTKVSTRGR
jgi:hypothetical protein